MLGLFLFASQALCAVFVLSPRQRFAFEEEFEAGKPVKFEFEEEMGLSPTVSVRNTANAIVASYKQSSAVLHTKSEQKSSLRFIFENPTNETMSVFFMLYDLSKESDAIDGPVNESVAVNELKVVLENIVKSQTKHLNRQKEHTKLLRSSKRLMTMLLAFEGLFCVAMVYYLHVETIKLFEKKRRI